MIIEKNKGKIIISVEKDHDRLNSELVRRGIAKRPEVALSTLLIHFVSLAIESDRDPAAIVNERLGELIDKVQKAGKNI